MWQLPRGAHLRERHAVGAQPVGVDHDLVLPDHAADGGDLGDAGHGLQLVLEEPVLQAAQTGQVMVAAAVYQGVLVDPADTGGIRTQFRPGIRGQPAGRLAEVFQHPGAGPVGIGAVLEDDVDIGVAKEGIAAHIDRPGYCQHRRGERVGDLVLDDLGCLSRIAGLDDDLDV